MNKRIAILLGIGLTLGLALVLIFPTSFIAGILDRLNHLSYDLQLRAEVFVNRKPDIAPIAIVDIDDRSLHQEGHWPWSRKKMGELVKAIQAEGASVIAFDILFSEAESNSAEVLYDYLKTQNKLSPENKLFLQSVFSDFYFDHYFSQQISAIPCVLAISFLPRQEQANQLPKSILNLNSEMMSDLSLIHAKGYLANIPILQNASPYAGFINIFSDNDGIFRQAPLVMAYQNKLYSSLALASVQAFLNESIQLKTERYHDYLALEGILLGKRFIKTNGKGEVLVPFIGRSYTFPYFSATDVLNHRLPKDSLNGKIIFVGTSATGLGDLKPTAIQNPFPGVEIQASIANGLLLNQFSYIPPWALGASLVLTLCLGLIAAFIFPYLGPYVLGILLVTLPPALMSLNIWIWKQTGLVLSFLPCIFLIILIAILNILYGYLFESRHRARLKEMFGQYVPEGHIDEMLKSKGDYGLEGENREMSVLFSDIRGFTSISEKMTASEVKSMLNEFFTPMTEIIFKHKGTIDKYVGDLIMAFWGAPLKDAEHANNAIASAVQMQKTIRALHPVFAQKHLPAIEMGIGINSGIMSIGDMGSAFRRNYTVLGDAVNLASRVESLTKYYGMQILITENTKTDSPKFIFQEIDKVRVKGKKEGVQLLTVYDAFEVSEGFKNSLKQWEKALFFYYQKNWNEAEMILKDLQEASLNILRNLYLERIAHFKENPPAEDWDGTFTHVSK